MAIVDASPDMRPGSLARRAGSSDRISVIVAVGLLAVFVAGLAAGAWTTHSGPNETATGTDVPAKVLAYWSFEAATVTTIPGTVPGAASSSVSTPTVLPSGTAGYVVNTATAGHGAVEWVLLEHSTAPASTEIELTLVDTTGTTPSTTSNTVFVETQSSVPGTTAYDFYYDAGAGALVFDNAQETSQPCSAVGTCP
jgi:hypothetical protein